MQNSIQKMLNEAYKACLEKGQRSASLIHMRLSANERVVYRSVRKAVVLLSLGLGYMVLAFKDSWVTHSPAFNFVGAGVCLVVLAICWAAGGVWWLFIGSKKIMTWAAAYLPFGIQPYKSASAIVIILILAGMQLVKLLRFGQGLPLIENQRKGYMLFVRLLAWLAAIIVCIAAIRLNMNVAE